MTIITETSASVNAADLRPLTEALTLDRADGLHDPAAPTIADQMDPLVEDGAQASAVLDLSSATMAELDRLIYSPEQLALQRDREDWPGERLRYCAGGLCADPECAACMTALRHDAPLNHLHRGGPWPDPKCASCGFLMTFRMRGGVL